MAKRKLHLEFCDYIVFSARAQNDFFNGQKRTKHLVTPGVKKTTPRILRRPIVKERLLSIVGSSTFKVTPKLKKRIRQVTIKFAKLLAKWPVVKKVYLVGFEG